MLLGVSHKNMASVAHPKRVILLRVSHVWIDVYTSMYFDRTAGQSRAVYTGTARKQETPL